MTTSTPQRGLQLRSLIHANGELELALHTVEVAPPEPTEVVVRVEAAPINPSDIGLLFGAADIETLATSGSGASDGTIAKPAASDRTRNGQPFGIRQPPFVFLLAGGLTTTRRAPESTPPEPAESATPPSVAHSCPVLNPNANGTKASISRQL